MAGASNSVYKFHSMVRGQNVYKSVCTLLTDWCSKTQAFISFILLHYPVEPLHVFKPGFNTDKYSTYIVNNLLADLLIRQTFFCQMLETSQFTKLSCYTVCLYWTL